MLSQNELPHKDRVIAYLAGASSDLITPLLSSLVNVTPFLNHIRRRLVPTCSEVCSTDRLCWLCLQLVAVRQSVLAADECVESHHHLTERTAPESRGGGKKSIQHCSAIFYTAILNYTGTPNMDI